MEKADSDRELFLAVGQRIRELRTAAGLSQEEFARKCGFLKQYANRLEGGQQNLNLRTLAKIASGLDLTLSDVVKGVDQKQ